jgi:hypothetical protein
MEYGGMVHALEEIRRLLKPTGVLIDIHPVAEAEHIEIHQGGRIDLAGDLTVRQWCFEFEQADIALAEVTRRGVFAVERESLFDSLTYYDSAEEMRASIKESIVKYARSPEAVDEAMPDAEALSDRIAELMQAAGSGAELVDRERTHISRLRPT